MRIAVIALAASAIASCEGATQPVSPVEPIAVSPSVQTSDTACARVLEGLDEYQREDGWSIVTRNDLLSSDAELWAQYHDAGLCPGVAEADLNGDGATEFAVTEIRREGEKITQRLVVYRPGRGTSERVWQADDVPFPHVVFRTDEREARDFYSGEVTGIPHGSFALERMEAWVAVYFEADGELRHVLVSD